MGTYADEAVVLRTHKLGEADRIITLLTREHGKVRAVARGVRRTSSKFGGRLEPFSHVDLLLATGRSLDSIAQAVTIRNHSDVIGRDYQRFTTGQVMVETADRLVPVEGEPAAQQYRLLAGALRTLAVGTTDGMRSPVTIMDSYLLRATASAGYAPSLSDCAKCGAAGPHEAFSPQAGGMVCRACRPPGSPQPSLATVAYLQALLVGDWPATRGVAAGVVNEASELVSAFTSWQLERGLRSLRHVQLDE